MLFAIDVSVTSPSTEKPPPESGRDSDREQYSGDNIRQIEIDLHLFKFQSDRTPAGRMGGRREYISRKVLVESDLSPIQIQTFIVC